MEKFSNTCRLCGRKLKDNVSKKRGYGPTCWIKVCKGRFHVKKITVESEDNKNV